MNDQTKKHIKHVVIIAPPYTSILDVAGPLDVFVKAANYIEESLDRITETYRVHVVSTDGSKLISTANGLQLVGEGSLKEINYPIDTLLISGLPNAPEKMVGKDTLDWIKDNWLKIRRVGSICAGAFVLAEAGILDGCNATTHWSRCEKLARLYPQIKVDPDPIFVKDGHVYTSAGISAGMDLALAMVEEDFGRDIALHVARMLVLYLKRPGNQSQFSVALLHQKVDYKPISELIDWIPEHLNDRLSVEMLAEQVAMSPRNFARVFTRETGVTPAKYLEKLRLETARRRLEESNLTMEEISGDCGMGSADSMRRIFLRHFKTTPGDYRRSFQTALN